MEFISAANVHYHLRFKNVCYNIKMSSPQLPSLSTKASRQFCSSLLSAILPLFFLLKIKQ